MHKSIFLLLIILVLTACNVGSEKKPVRTDGYSQIPATREDSLFHDVMKGHDTGMARMGKLSKSMTLVQEKLDSIELLTGNAAARAEDMRQSFASLLEELRQADEGMSMWMQDFKADSGQGNPEIRINYLENEKQKVEKVKTDILESLRKADSMLLKQ